MEGEAARRWAVEGEAARRWAVEGEAARRSVKAMRGGEVGKRQSGR